MSQPSREKIISWQTWARGMRDDERQAVIEYSQAIQELRRDGFHKLAEIVERIKNDEKIHMQLFSEYLTRFGLLSMMDGI